MEDSDSALVKPLPNEFPATVMVRTLGKLKEAGTKIITIATVLAAVKMGTNRAVPN